MSTMPYYFASSLSLCLVLSFITKHKIFFQVQMYFDLQVNFNMFNKTYVASLNNKTFILFYLVFYK